MESEAEQETSLLPNILKGIAIAVAFVAASALFAVLLRPLAAPAAKTETVTDIRAAADIAGSGAAAARTTPSPAVETRAETPLPPLPKGPKIAILVIELGNDAAAGTATIRQLPAAFGLAFLPAASQSATLARAARKDGHEIWVGLPMQPKGWPKISPGPNTLLLSDAPAANVRRVEWAISRIDKPDGAYTMMGSAFTASAKAMQPVAAALTKHNLALLDTRSIGSTVAAKMTKAAGGRALTNDLFIDARTDPASINATLAQLVAQARARGQAVGVARALPGTMELLTTWSQSLEKSGVTLVPPSRLAS